MLGFALRATAGADGATASFLSSGSEVCRNDLIDTDGSVSRLSEAAFYQKNLLLVTAAVALAGCLSTAANADYSVQVSTGLTSGNGFTTNNVNPFASLSNTATATFTYTGDISFDNEQAQNSSPSGDLNSTFFGSNASNISGYHGSGQVQLNSSTTIADFSGTRPCKIPEFQR